MNANGGRGPLHCQPSPDWTVEDACVHGRRLLNEFKRPKAPVGRDAERQAKEYRDDLTPQFGHMQILIIGGQVDERMSAQYQERDVTFTSYNAVISRARRQLQWLLDELARSTPAQPTCGTAFQEG
jgi:hypothetical protein